MVVAIVYIDDAIFCDPSKAIVDKIEGHVMRKWECQDLGEATEFYTYTSDVMATKSTLINMPIWIRSLSTLDCRMQTPLLHLFLRGITPFTIMG